MLSRLHPKKQILSKLWRMAISALGWAVVARHNFSEHLTGLATICSVVLVLGWWLSPWQALAQSGFEYNGITHVSWWFDEYTYSDATTSRDVLAATNANWAAVLVTWYQDNANSTVIARQTESTPTDDAIRTAILELHNHALKVMLKPHVDPLNGQWRGEISPSNIDAWFASYSQFILHYAQMAQDLDIEAFCLGTEFKTISGAANRNRWIGVIDAIRGVYSGFLTYAANATSPADEFTSVSFWDHLDLLGLDAYFPLTDRTDVSLADLIAAWRRNRFEEDAVAAAQNFADSRQKPVIFTEIGYKSVDGANREPWNFSLSGAYDPNEQRDCYEAAFSVWSQQSSWMKGIFWWAWPVPAPGPEDTDYNPRGKPAEAVLKAWYAPLTPRSSLTLELQRRREQLQQDLNARAGELALLHSRLPQGVNTEMQNQKGSTALLGAIKKGEAESVRRLLAAGASANAVLSSGRTPLIEAAEQGQIDIARLLIEAGADLNAVQRGWGTALETAERNGHLELATMLQRTGARSSGRSVGDTVCVRPWQGDGYCGMVEEVNKTVYRIRVTELAGCTNGCAARADCSEGRPVGGPDGIQAGEVITIVNSCLTHTGVRP